MLKRRHYTIHYIRAECHCSFVRLIAHCNAIQCGGIASGQNVKHRVKADVNGAKHTYIYCECKNYARGNCADSVHTFNVFARNEYELAHPTKSDSSEREHTQKKRSQTRPICECMPKPKRIIEFDRLPAVVRIYRSILAVEHGWSDAHLHTILVVHLKLLRC